MVVTYPSTLVVDTSARQQSKQGYMQFEVGLGVLSGMPVYLDTARSKRLLWDSINARFDLNDSLNMSGGNLYINGNIALDLNRRFYSADNQGITLDTAATKRLYYNGTNEIYLADASGPSFSGLNLLKGGQSYLRAATDNSTNYSELVLAFKNEGLAFWVGLGSGYNAAYRGLSIDDGTGRQRFMDMNRRFYTQPIASSGGLEMNQGGASKLFGYDLPNTRFDLNDSLNMSGGNGTYLKVPTMPQANRPGVPAAGMIMFNTNTNQFEGYNGAAWVILG